MSSASFRQGIHSFEARQSLVAEAGRGSKALVREALASEAGRARALRELNLNMYAASSAAPRGWQPMCRLRAGD